MHQRKSKIILLYFFLLVVVSSISNYSINNLKLGEIPNIKISGLKNNEIFQNMSISPKFISIKRSKTGNAIVISKEFLGEYFNYKVSINDNIFRVRTDINNHLNNGDKCFVSIKNNSYYFLYPGGQKVYI